MILTLSLSVIIGLLLGLLGGGGSILTVPMLVYLLGLDPKKAIVTSFVVVGISSLMALIPHARRQSVCWKSGIFFSSTGMVGAYGGGHLAGHFSGDVLMALFGMICLLTGAAMINRKEPQTPQVSAKATQKFCLLKIPYLRILFDGFFVGALTGMVGVGGGFLIVPALTLLVGMPIQGAVGTSLLVIAMNAAAGLAGYSQHVSLDLNLTLLVAGGSIAGSALGAWWSAYVKPAWLRRVFGFMVILIAGYVLSQSLTWHLLSIFEAWASNPRQLEWALGGLILFWLILRISRWIHKSEVKLMTDKELSLE